jgi:hypothetical protein
MRPPRRLITFLLALVVAGAIAPTALAGKRKPPPTAQPAAPVYVAPSPISVSLIDVEALR